MDFSCLNNAAQIKKIAGCIDHTLLKPEATKQDIARLCEEASGYGFASVCLNPVFVPYAFSILKDTKVNVCTVIGFPLGADTTEAKVFEAVNAAKNGAAEIDMVIQIGALREGRDEEVFRDISEVVNAVKQVNDKALVKTIIETCLLTDEEKKRACQLAESAGADFVKTSTGFSLGGAKLSDVKLMRQAVSQNIGVKASGGIRNISQVNDFLEAGATRIGTSSGVNIILELESISQN